MGVPTCVKFVAHTPLLQAGVAQSLARPHCVLSVHPTHAPVLSQYSDPPAPHVEFVAFGVNVGVPLLHVSSVHSLPSLGRSVSSFCVVVAPLPSQIAALQSPAVCVATCVPCATGAVPHFSLSHVRVTHSLPGSGQSASTVSAVHSAIDPLELEVELEVELELELDVVGAPPPPGLMSFRSTFVMISHPVVDMNVTIAIPNHDAFALLIDRTLMTLPFRKSSARYTTLPLLHLFASRKQVRIERWRRVCRSTASMLFETVSKSTKIRAKKHACDPTRSAIASGFRQYFVVCPRIDSRTMKHGTDPVPSLFSCRVTQVH